MGLPKVAVATVLGAALLIAAPDPSAAKVTARQIEKATTVEELVALGATKLTASQFKSMVVGKPMSGQGWDWVIAPNGTTSSAAKDGSWSEVDAPWKMKGDAYCTPIDGAMACRDVYLIGNYLRMSDKADPAKLSTWTVKVEK